MKKYRLSMILGSIVTLLPMIAGLILWDQLPKTIPVHWGVSESAEVMAGPWFIVLLFPLILLAVQWMMIWISFRDARTKQQNPKALNIVFWIIPVISVFSSCTIYAGALGGGVQLLRFTPLLMGVLFLVIGNTMPKITPNFYLGIKTPWTFYTEENWHATHRFCGKITVLCGLLAMCGVFFPVKLFPVTLTIPIVLMTSAAFLYPYLYYRKQVKEGLTPISKKPISKKYIIAIVITVLAMTVLGSVIGYITFTGNIAYRIEETSFTIEADFWKDITIEYEAISSMEYLEKADHGSRFSGFGSPRLSMGTFSNKSYGNFTLYAYTKCPAAIVIRCGDRILMISSATVEETAQLYETLKEKIQ